MKGKKKKKPAAFPAIIALSVLFIVAAAGLFFLHIIPRSTTTPVFEEEYASSNEFKSIITKVDNLLYEALYKEGVNEEDISFSKVVPRRKRNLDWDFTEMNVRLNNPDSVGRLETRLPQKIYSMHQDVSVESEKVSSDQVFFNIKVFNCVTHRLELKYKARKKIRSAHLPKVAFIIDDIGYDISLAASFMDLEIPVCLSILPNAPYSKKIAAATVNKGGEILLHLPMEPKGYPRVNPGKGALMVSMDRETIQKIVREDIIKFPGLKGVNHHMGSLFSEDYTKMKHVLDEVKKHDLYYIDSRTTDRTVAYKVAKALGVPAAEKKWFIDNDLSETALKYQMDRLLGFARYSGSAIGIGHPHKETLNILKIYTKQLIKSYEVVPVSELVK